MLFKVLVALFLCSIASAGLFSSQKNSFKVGDLINLKVNGLSSSKTHIPYEYYYLPFPKPKETMHKASSLGELIMANHIENSLYDVRFKENSTCVAIGEMDYDEKQVKKFIEFIDNEYLAEILVDNLPGIMNIRTTDGSVYYEHGYPVGGILVQYGNNTSMGYALNNHLDFKIFYNDESAELSSIVGFEIAPRSIRYSSLNEVPSACQQEKIPSMSIQGKGAQPGPHGEVHVIFSYSVQWLPSTTEWSHRFDRYSNSQFIEETRRIHWFSILNSLLVLLFLSGMVAFIVVRTVFQDFARYNRLPTDESEDLDIEDSGWKMVHADCFRPPEHGTLLLAVLLGSGAQLLGMALGSVLLALAGMVTPENRGVALNLLLALYVLMSFLNGRVSLFFYRSWGGVHFKRAILLAGTLLPTVVFGIYGLQNALSAAYHSTTAVSFLSILKLVAIWLCLSFPLVVLGALSALRRPVYEPPVATSAIPREIPPQPWYIRKLPLILVGGLVPFGVIFVELYFFLSSVWMGYGYYLFGFLFAVLLILLVTTSEISIVLTYSLLCAENYHWWWMSFLAPASSGVYALAFSVYYLVVAFNLDNVLVVVESVGYLLILSVVFSLLTGCVGFFASFLFVNALFGSVKVD